MKHRNLLRAILLTLVFAVISNAQQFSPENIRKGLSESNSNEVGIVVSTIKMELPDYFPGEIAAAIKNSYPAIPEDRTIRVLPYVREHMITQGNDYDRVKGISDKLLKFMALDHRVKIIYFDSEVPVTAFTYPFALIVSSAAANLLNDEELEAVMAHEICHLIIYPVFKEAVEKKNTKLQRTLELFCDAGSIIIIQAKGKDPEALITGLEKMLDLAKRVNNDEDTGIYHPTLKQRKKLLNELSQKISIALNRAIQK